MPFKGVISMGKIMSNNNSNNTISSQQIQQSASMNTIESKVASMEIEDVVSIEETIEEFKSICIEFCESEPEEIDFLIHELFGIINCIKRYKR